MLLFTGVMHADVIFSENFNETTAQLGVTQAGAFTAINGTNVDIVGPGDGWGWLCSGNESGNCVDLGGTGGNSVGNIDLSTSLNLAAGTYNLTFDLNGSQRGNATTTIVNFGSDSWTIDLASDGSTVFSQDVTVAGGPVQLQFIDVGANDNIGAVLDNIQVSSTPEPGSLALLGTGMVGFAGVLRRKLWA